MSRPRNPNGVRRAHTRNGKPVRAGHIKRRQAPKRRLNAAAKRRAQRKPLLAGAAGLLGLGALDAILSGRWGGFLVLGSFAVGLTVTHYGWQWHKNRQARKPRVSAAEQRRQARAKAREGQAALTHKEPSEGPPELLSDGAPGTKKAPAPKRPAPQVSASAANDGNPPEVSRQELNRTTSSASSHNPTSHAESVAARGWRCDCSSCRAKRKAEKTAGVLR